MRKKIAAKILMVFLLIFTICGVGIFIINVKIGNMSKVNEQIGGPYLTSIQELDKVSLNVSYLQGYSKDFLLADGDAKDGILSNITSTQGNILTSLETLKESATTSREQSTVEQLVSSYKAYTDAYNQMIQSIQSGSIRESEQVDECLSALNEDLKVRVQSVNILNVTNMIRAQKNLTDATKASHRVFIAVGIFLAISYAIGMFTAYNTIAKPTQIATKELNALVLAIEDNHGDLTKRVPQKTIDEVGQLVSGINKFIAVLQKIISEIKVDSNEMRSSVDSVNEQIGIADKNISDVSATMEELSAGMMEIENVVENLYEKSEEVEQAALKIATEANDGSGMAKEIQEKAARFREDGVKSKQLTNTMAEEISELLKEALEKSRDVEKINHLTEDILSISSKTNLLALNASIEAARAGEAGRGFSVVAEEIRVLADSSKNTANDIQEISTEVTNAVNMLAENANKMIEFMIQTILPDYDKLVLTGTQYSEDANQFEQLLYGFSENAGELKETMQQMTSFVKNIAGTISESSSGINLVAQNACELTGSISQIREEITKTEDIAGRLTTETNLFEHV